MVKYQILYVLQKMDAGGEELMVLDHLFYLDRKIYEPHLVVISNKGDLLTQIPSDIPYYGLEDEYFDTKNIFIRQLNKMTRLYKLISLIKPHIIFTALFDASLFIKIVKKMCPHKFIFISREPHNHLKDLQGSSSLKDIVRAKLLPFAFSSSDIIVTVSKGSMKEISDCYKIPLEKFRVIYNSIDVSKIKAQAGIPSNSFRLQHPAVVSLGRLVYRKGFQYLIQALTILPETYLYIIGKGDYEASLLALTHDAGLNDRVHFLGYQENPYNILRQADVFVFPSLWEGFGNVIIEAMACGVPVVSTRCPYGPEEIIEDKENGVLVEMKDVKGLANGINLVINDTGLKEKLIANGLKRAGDFDVKTYLVEYSNLYQSMINKVVNKAQ